MNTLKFDEPQPFNYSLQIVNLQFSSDPKFFNLPPSIKPVKQIKAQVFKKVNSENLLVEEGFLNNFLQATVGKIVSYTLSAADMTINSTTSFTF